MPTPRLRHSDGRHLDLRRQTPLADGAHHSTCRKQRALASAGEDVELAQVNRPAAGTVAQLIDRLRTR